MEVFIAKQPIYDIQNNIIAYELLFRSGKYNFYDSIDGTAATIDVIYNSFYTIGIENITNGKKAFINLTEKLIKEEIITILPPKLVSIEILEDVEITDELIIYCKSLKEKGYSIILDDFIFNEKYRVLIELVDIIKIDFRATLGIERRNVIEKVNNPNIKFLAEKVETIEEVNEAKKLGYTYFQGYYFGKPDIISANDIPPNKISTSKLMRQIEDGEINIDIIGRSVEKDVSILYKLLKFMNSSMFGLKTEISSVEYAINEIGREKFIKWLEVMLIANLKKSQDSEAADQALFRAKFAHNICIMSGRKEEAFKAYIMGMVSLMNSILNCSIDDIVKKIDLYGDVCFALKGGNNYLGKILNIIKAYEKNDWKSIKRYCENTNIDSSMIIKAHDGSITWAENV
ncbi:EAL and HDOD domain-containing protein [Clostridium oryzae]|uniref:Putative membrane protein YjcC n=1 Tax=Clostridium oryzae TaxID=1450648 RepID=A0A1V4IEM0_9CLOT|nr:EAL domain-containing protein [Clostridium oryzae]OPJ58095.1 putative membrane protein YjcC [Clostridium oryzae]